MFEIGPSLREAREKRGLSEEDVHKAIRIRPRYLNALEEERWELLPGEAYTKGFLRTYAEFLGLNGNLYVDEFNTRHARREDGPLLHEALAPSSAPRIGIVRPLVAILAIVAIVAAVAAWQLHRSSAPKTHTPAATPASRPAAKSKAAAKPASKPAAKHVALPTHAVLAATRGRVWLLVRAGGPSGTVLFTGFLEQGQTYPLSVTATKPVWIRIGAPWNLDVRLGGKLLHGLPTSVGNVLLTQRGLRPG
jgi:transcriptional regulator with XRE-family HTH domain